MNNQLSPFEGIEIRKVWHNEEWFFLVVDIIGILTDSEKPSQYWHNMKKRDNQLSPICLKLKLVGLDGKARPSDCSNT
jgi:DNA-damage-inducible protein D